MSREFGRKVAFQTLSQIGIAYRRSPLSRTLAGVAGDAPQAGDRFPWLRLKFQGGGSKEDVFQRLDDTRFNLIAIGQPTPSAESLALGDMLRVHVVPFDTENQAPLAAVSISAPAYYLLRPDGHVGLAGRQLDEAALRRWFTECHIRLGDATREEADRRVRVG
jgi:aromatic ring hydroxylase-like protein